MANSEQNQGVIYVVATAIGNLADITNRALHILANVAVIAAEDTRHSKRLLSHFNITTPCVALHEHNEQSAVKKLLNRVKNGDDIALISDAGTPLISDPGFHLISSAREQGIQTIPIPGACAAIAALSAAGLPSDRFVFEGFLPALAGPRIKRLETLRDEIRTLIFYEAPHRIQATIADMLTVFGPEREVVLARELTKIYETIYGNKLVEMVKWLGEDSNRTRGEFVILVHGASKVALDSQQLVTLSVMEILQQLLAELPLKQAVLLTAKITGARKNYLYDLAVKLGE